MITVLFSFGCFLMSIKPRKSEVTFTILIDLVLINIIVIYLVATSVGQLGG